MILKNLFQKAYGLQEIYKNFNAAVTMLKSNENGLADPTTAEAVRLFVHNIFDANVRIVLAYGLA